VKSGPLRRDPAPSRWAYRWQRLWLTPMFRILVRVGLPITVMAGAVMIWAADQGRRDAMWHSWTELRAQFQNRPEFMVNEIQVEGASSVLAEAVRVALNLQLPLSSFDIDLAASRQLVEAFDAVERAELRILTGGVLQIGITERMSALVWRMPEGLWLLDEHGHRVGGLGARELRGDLPLVAGEGADLMAAEALALVQAAGPLVPRLRGLVRVGERRWDMVLDRDQRVLLPPEDPVRALEGLLALDQAEGTLSRDILVVDLRNDRRPTLRLSQEATETLRQNRAALTGG